MNNEEMAAKLDELDRNSPMYIAYFLIDMEKEHGDAFVQFIPPGKEARWMEYRAVGMRFPKSRLRPGLSYSHYKLVMNLEREQQDKLLDMAEQLELSVPKFRQCMPDYKPRAKKVSYKEKYERLDEAIFTVLALLSRGDSHSATIVLNKAREDTK